MRKCVAARAACFGVSNPADKKRKSPSSPDLSYVIIHLDLFDTICIHLLSVFVFVYVNVTSLGFIILRGRFCKL